MYEPENLIDSLSYQEDDTSLLPNVLSATLEPRRPADENGACSPKIPPPFTTELANFSEPHFPLASFNEFAVGEDFEVHQGHFKLSDVNPDSKEASVSIHEDTSYFINNNLMNNYVSDTYSTMESAPSSTVTAPSEPRSLRKRSAEGKLEQRQSSSYAIKKASILSSPKTSIPFFKGTGEEEQSYLSCSEEEEEAVYCICRGPDDYTLMIQCGCCEEW